VLEQIGDALHQRGQPLELPQQPRLGNNLVEEKLEMLAGAPQRQGPHGLRKLRRFALEVAQLRPPTVLHVLDGGRIVADQRTKTVRAGRLFRRLVARNG
jgi:hypothetical protein